MADPVVRQVAFYWRDKKAITANKVSIAFKMNREPLWGQEGILAWSKGHAVMTITASGFTPVGGSYTTNDIEKMLNQDDIPISFVLGGKFYRESAAATDLKYDSDSEKGTTMEEVTLTCRRPKITG
jgi:hypothetical protein